MIQILREQVLSKTIIIQSFMNFERILARGLHCDVGVVNREKRDTENLIPSESPNLACLEHAG